MGLRIYKQEPYEPVFGVTEPLKKAGGNLHVIQPLSNGEGASGAVWRAVANGITIAIKAIHTAPQDEARRPSTGDLPELKQTDQPSGDETAKPQDRQETEVKRQANLHAAVREYSHMDRAWNGAQTTRIQPFLRPLGVLEIAEEIALSVEFFAGKSLNELLTKQQIDHRRKIQIALVLCHALRTLEAKGIQHRDLKPDNILIQIENGKLNLKLIDFGIAIDLADHQNGFNNISGTAEYMPPKVIQDFYQSKATYAPLDPRSDIYALGVILYQLFLEDFEAHPYLKNAEGTEIEIIHQIMAIRNTLQIRQLPEYLELNPELEFLIYQMLHLDPHQRPDIDTVARHLIKFSQELASAA